jgi:hypothetical protein
VQAPVRASFLRVDLLIQGDLGGGPD